MTTEIPSNVDILRAVLRALDIVYGGMRRRNYRAGGVLAAATAPDGDCNGHPICTAHRDFTRFGTRRAAPIQVDTRHPNYIPRQFTSETFSPLKTRYTPTPPRYIRDLLLLSALGESLAVPNER